MGGAGAQGAPVPSPLACPRLLATLTPPASNKLQGVRLMLLNVNQAAWGPGNGLGSCYRCRHRVGWVEGQEAGLGLTLAEPRAPAAPVAWRSSGERDFCLSDPSGILMNLIDPFAEKCSQMHKNKNQNTRLQWKPIILKWLSKY